MGTPVVAVRDLDIDAVLRRVYSVKPLPIPILRGSLSISVEIRFLSNDWLEQKCYLGLLQFLSSILLDTTMGEFLGYLTSIISGTT